MPKTESQETKELLQELRLYQPTWVILKHSDRFSKGIPDVSISLGRRTLWLERKRLHAGQRLDQPSTWVDNLVQLETLVKLNGWYHVHDPQVGKTLVVEARLVRAMVIEKKACTSPYYRPDDSALQEFELLVLRYLNGEDVHV